MHQDSRMSGARKMRILGFQLGRGIGEPSREASSKLRATMALRNGPVNDGIVER
jgi:hypothetical protein